MKKSRFVSSFVIAIIVGILLFSLTSSSVKAVDLTQTANLAQQSLGQVGQAAEIITHPETQAEIVKNQWTKFISNTAIGKFFVAITPFIKKLDPLFKLVLGTGFEWSWLFILSFVLAFSLIMFFRRFISVFTVSFQIKSKLLDYGIPLLIVILLSLTNVTITITKLIVKLINTWFTTVLMQIIAGIGVAVLIFWFFSLSSVVKKFADKLRETIEKKRLKKDVEKLKEEVKEEAEKAEKRAKGEEIPTKKEVEEELEGKEPTKEEKGREEERKRREERRRKGERFIENIGKGIEESEKEEGEEEKK